MWFCRTLHAPGAHLRQEKQKHQINKPFIKLPHNDLNEILNLKYIKTPNKEYMDMIWTSN